MVADDARSGDAALDQWFTPFWAAEELAADAIRDLGRVSICEPSCGTGSFLAAIPRELAAFGIDIDPLVIPAAIANSGREVLLGDFRSIDLGGREIELIMGNPPFNAAVLDGFVDRAHELLPDQGMLALILPSTIYRTNRIARWAERFSIDVALIPKTLFGRLEYPLTWAKMRKGAAGRFYGLMLFAEQREIELMRDNIRAALAGPGTWRSAVRLALESLGGEGSLAAIYDRIAPERAAGRAHWRPKVRQILQRHHRPVERGRWAMGETA